MNTISTKGIVGIIVAIVIIGGGIYMGLQGRDSSLGIDPMSNTNQESASTTVSMRDLVQMGTSMRCTFDHVTDVSRSRGEVLVADGKIRGNFKVVATAVGEQEFDAFMITDGNDSYVWSSLMEQGFKTVIQTESDMSASQGGLDYNQKLNYDCNPWVKDVSVFIPPTSITFSELPTGIPAQ